ncbi:phage tail spike protein [Clostridium perfringens]
MLQLLDLNKNKIAGLTEYKDLCIESVLKTGDKTLSFLYCKNSKHYFDIVEEAYIRTKENEFVVKEKNVQKDYTTFICKLNVEELEGHTFDRFESKEQTITDALNLAIVNTGWTVAKNTITKKRTVRKTNCSVWEIIQDIKKTYRVEIEFDTLNKQIKVYECLGSDKGTYFIDSLNLKTVDIQSNSYDFYTRIIPVGKDGITIEDVNNGKKYVENYQYSKKVKTLIWKDERYTIKENLKDDAIAKLIDISKPYKAYKVEILNLAELSNEYKNVLDYHLGDTITLISKDNKIKEKQRIVKTKIYPEDHFKDSCELSNTVLSFEDIQKQFQEAAETIDNVTTDNGTIDGSSIDSVKTNQIEDFEANVIKVAKLKAVLAEIENLHANKADIQNLNAVVAKIGTLEATKASITQLDAVNAVIQNLKAGKADITDLNAAVAKISVLESKASTIDNLVSQKADIKDLNALNANISNALIKKANVAELEAMEAKTNKLIANKADISDLNAANANINSIKADTADIKTLINGNLSSENIQTGGITSDKLTISDGFIKDAMIANVSASKLAAGTIDAAKINVVNLNADNLTVGKINGHLLKDGSISGLAIGNGAIDNSKVAPGANIEASKININSVVTAINAGSTLLTANKIAIDSEKGTLDIAFNNLNTSLEANKKATESNSTAINVVQGKLSASIENSKVLEGKQKNLEDNYNRTVVTVDSLKNTVGQQKTLIDSATGKITSVEAKANTLEKNLNGLTQTVTDTKKVIENNKTSLESKNAELKANIDKVSSSLSSVSNTVDKNNKALVSKTNTLEQTLNGLAQTVSSNKSTTDGKISNVENVTHELKSGLSGLTSKLDTLKSSTDGINKTIINQGSAINQLQDSIKLKVDSSTFNKSTETINSSINKAKEDAVNSAKANTINAISSIEVGSENLLDDSEKERTNFPNAQGEYLSVNITDIIKSNLGKQIVLSGEIKTLGKEGNINIYSLGRYQFNNSKTIKCTTKEFIPFELVITPTYNSKGDNGETCNWSFYGIYGSGVYPYVRKLKISLGNKKSSWSPSANDLKKYSDDVAKAKADLAQANAIANADGKITVEEKKRIQQAEANLNTAIAKADKAKADAISEANRVSELKKNEAIKTAGLDAANKAKEALNSAKAYTNAEITTVNTHLNKNTSEINILKDKIESKVSQSDIDKTIENVKFGDRNLFPEIYLGSHGCIMRKLENFYMNIPTYNIVVNRPNQGNNFGFNIRKPIKINGGKGLTFTFLFNYIINKYINNHSSNMHGYTRVYYKDGSKQDFDFDLKIINCNDKSNWGKWISLKFTFTTDINKEIDNIGLFYFYTDGASEGTDFNFTIPKLVIGNKIGDWTPAPEDMDQAITDNIKTVTDKISTVESNLTQTKSSIEANVKDLKSKTESITTNVSNINRDLTNKINSNLNTAIAKATEAETKAKSYADSKKQEAINSANTHADSVATSKANTAKQDAINTSNAHADSVAANKATEALNNAKSYTNAQVSTVNTKVSNVESNLNVLKDKINTKVSQSDIDKSISNITIGGRNLLINSNRVVGESSNGEFVQYADIAPIFDKYGLKEYTISFDLKSKNTSKNSSIQVYCQNGSSAKYSFNKTIYVTTKYKRYSVTVIPELADNSLSESWLAFYGIYDTGNVPVVRNVKIELGNKATDWTPAPEDMDQAITDNIKTVNSKISNVESTLTQTKNSIESKINSVNSKTQSIESSLNGKATKQEVTNVDSKVTTLTSNLNSITQRVSNSESKTHTLETSLNGKASKQEVTAVNSKVASIETNINGITQRVGNSESKINSLNGQVLNAATKHELTEFKQSTNDFKWKVEQGLGGNNLIKNSGFLNGYSQFFVTEYQWNGVNSSVNVWGDSSEWVMTGTNALVIRGTNGSHGAYGVRQENIKLKPNTTYTLSGYAAVHRGDWRISLAQNDWGWIASSRGNKSGGKNPDNWNRFEITFKTGPAHDYLTNCKLDLMLENAHNDAYAWFTNLVLNEGNIANKWQQFNNELYTSNMSFDSNGLYCSFSDGSHSSMGKDGFEWFNAGTGHSYHALAYVTSFGIPAGNPGRAYVKLPVEFTKRRKSLKWTVALRGYYYSTSGDFFPMHVHASGTEEYEENGILVCPIEGYCKIQNAQNSSDIQFRPLTAMLIAIA